VTRLRLAAVALVLWIGGGAPIARADLLEAAAKGDIAEVRRAVAAQEDLEARDKRGWTPLMYAASRGKLDCAQLLLEAGADANSRATEGSTPLIGAAVAGHIELVQLLLKRGADPTLANRAGATAQSKAREYGHAAVDALLGRAMAQRPGSARGAQAIAPSSGAAPLQEPLLGTGFDVDDLQEVYVLVEDTTFRKQPTMGAPAAGQFPMGVAIRVTGKVRGRDWYRVGPATSSVFVPGRAIKPAAKAPAKP
jgi:hypothetical protein